MDLFKENNIVAIRVPSNCMDKLQPIDVSVNKPIKDMMRSKFQTWYASKVAEQLKEVSVANVKVDISVTVIKPKCANQLISILQNLQQHPEVFVNGFKGAGIWDPVMSVISKFVIIQTIKSCIYVHMYDTVYIQYVTSTIYHVYILQSSIIFIYTSDCNHGNTGNCVSSICSKHSIR